MAPQLKRERRKVKNVVRPGFLPFQETGVNIGVVPYIETHPRDVVVEHLKDGIDKEVSC